MNPIAMRRNAGRLIAATVIGLGLANVPVQKALALPKDTLTYVDGSNLDTLDPGLSHTRTVETVLQLMFQNLVQWNDTSLSKIVPQLAKSWTRSPDGLEWTFKIRKGIRFQDGTVLDAHAVKFDLDRLRSKKYASPSRSIFSPISEIDVPSKYTLVIKTKEPYPALIPQLAESAAMISSPTAIKKYGSNYGEHPVGTGPYKLKEWIPGQECVLERSKIFFGKPAHFKEIIYRPVPEGQARVVELETGHADIVGHIPPQAVARLKKNPNVKIDIRPSSFQTFFQLNNRRPPFNDVRVRKAVNYAIDRKAILEKILDGYGQIPTGPVPKGVQAHTVIGPWGYDPAKAKKLLHEAFPDGYKGTVVLWTPNGRYLRDKDVAEAVQGYLNAIGLKTSFRAWEWSSYQGTLYRKDPSKSTGHGSGDANMWMLGTSIPTADYRLRRIYDSHGSANITGYDDPKVDALLDKARLTPNYDARMKVYAKVEKLVWFDNPPFLYLLNQVQITGMRKNIEDFQAYAFERFLLAGVRKK